MNLSNDLTHKQIFERAEVATLAGDTGENCFLCGDSTGLTPSWEAMLCRSCYCWYVEDNSWLDYE